MGDPERGYLDLAIIITDTDGKLEHSREFLEARSC